MATLILSAHGRGRAPPANKTDFNSRKKDAYFCRISISNQKMSKQSLADLCINLANMLTRTQNKGTKYDRNTEQCAERSIDIKHCLLLNR